MTDELEILLDELSNLESDDSAARTAYEVLRQHPKVWDIAIEMIRQGWWLQQFLSSSKIQAAQNQWISGDSRFS
jgi:hypothetical protein